MRTSLVAAFAGGLCLFGTVANAQTAHTPDGQPDLQGMYTRNGVVDLEANAPENPIDPSGKNPLSVSNRGDGLGPYPKIFGEGGAALRGGQRRQQRRTGIIDPLSKVLPWIPAQDKLRREFLLKMNPAADLRHVELNARCALPGLFQGEDNNNPYQFLQRPGEVVILYDYNHTSRVIHLDGRPHLGKNIRLFMGDSIGHWEGNTLVVDTTNFNGRIAYSREIPYLSEELHTVERFTIADANIIDYEVTIQDPKLFTAPWKVAGYFSRVPKGTESLEFACAEGSQTLVNIFGLPPKP
ncbi:MAG: hypothetical protein JO336_21640 [Acidobacteriia bacterium]|nr:hypothetical protein [Terriglobia bacterium]MBV8903215.1 hypothetical protein [Terriglobia bacterium]